MFSLDNFRVIFKHVNIPTEDVEEIVRDTKTREATISGELSLDDEKKYIVI